MRKAIIQINRVKVSGVVAFALALSGLTASANWVQEFVSLPPVSPGGGVIGGIQPLSEASGTTDCVDETALTPEIETAVQALRNDPVRIYEFVRNQIRYDVPTYGVKVGARGAFLAGHGNDWDQAALLCAMLRAAGHVTRYATAIVYYETEQLSRWAGFGGHGDPNAVLTVFVNGGWPNEQGTAPSSGYDVFYPSGEEIWTGIRRIWVEVEIDGQWFTLDPAFVDSEVSREDVSSLMGFNRANLLAAAMQGASAGADWVEGINETNLTQSLTALTDTLRQAVLAEHDHRGLAALIGGRRFVESPVEELPTSLPHAKDVASASRTTFNHVPSERILSLRIQYRGIDHTLAGHELGGRALTLTHNASDSFKPLLKLDGQPVAEGIATTPNTIYTLSWWVDQPYSGGWADDDFQQTLTSPGAYVLVYDFGSASRRRTRRAARDFERLLASGVDPETEPARLAAMHAAAASGLEQWRLSTRLLGKVFESLNYTHHFLGVFGQEEGYFVDLPGIRSQTLPYSGSAVERGTLFKADAFFTSALEHGILEQTQGADRPAASTIKLLALNNALTNRTFLADSANWQAIRQELVGYTHNALDELDKLILKPNPLILLPEDGSLAVRQWSGHGFAHLWRQPNWSQMSMGMIIGGGYSGGYAGDPLPYDVGAAQNLVARAISPAPTSEIGYTPGQDPVNMHNGDLHVEKPVLTLGAAPPLGLRFGISYSSGETAREGPLGRGWRHSLDARIQSGSDGAVMFGARRAADATPLIVAARVVADLLDENASAAEWTVAALVTQWAIDQTIENTVSARMGDSALTYVRMPDGAYNPPPGVTTELIQTNGQYRLVERFGTEFHFDANGRAESIIDLHGRATQFAYNAQTNLQSVTDAYGRELTFSYSDGRLVQAADDTGRIVAFDYDGDDLIRLTDPDAGDWEYRYDDGHRIVALIDPQGQTTASNVYNQVGQVITQYNGHAEAWAFHCAGYIGTEVDPEGNALTHRFDLDGRNLGTEDALGHRTLNRFDAQGRLIEHRDANGNQTRFHYDAHNNLTNRTDALGNAWTFAYDAGHRLVAGTDPLGHVTRFYYDSFHQVTNIVDALTNSVATAYHTSGAAKGLPHIVTDARGNTAEYAYNALGQPIAIARTDGGTVTHQWNARGDLLAIWDANGNPTTMTYDNRRNLTSVTDALGHTVSNIYNAAGLKTAVIDPLGRQTVTAWTSSYKPASVTHPDGGIVTNLYDNRDLLVAVIDPRGGVHSNRYDRARRKIGATDPLGNHTGYALDPNGNILAVTNALGHVIHAAYDALNRATNAWEILPGGTRSVASVFDEAGRLVSSTDANGFTTAYEYDALNRRTAVIKPDGTVERFEYDPAGNLLVFRNALGHPRSFAHDGMNRLTSETSPIGRIRQYQYDPGGNLIQRIDADESVVTYSHDPANRLVGIQYPGGANAVFEYNALGLRTAQSNAVAHVQYGYDIMNRLAAVTQTVSAVSSVVSYAYDLNGNRTAVTYPGGLNVNYAFDLANRLTQVTDWAQRQTAYDYDALHRQTGIDYPNASTAAFAWDVASRLTGLAHSTNGTAFVDRAYTLDLHGNITAMTVNAGLLPQIAPKVKRLRQNPADELTSIQTKANPGVQDWNTTNPVHDLEGNLVSDGSRTFSYDYENRLVLCDSATLRETYFYAADGSRVAAETVTGGTTNLTIHVLDHGDPLRRPLAKLDATGQPVRYFVWGNGLVAQIEAGSGIVRYFHADGQGSTLALTDATAAITDQWFHDPYGETLNRTGTTTTPYQWIGGHGVRTEATGLHFMRHRYYHAGLKRFTATDPLGVRELLGRGVLANLYQYANNSPLVYMDPDGELAFVAMIGVGMAIGAVVDLGVSYTASRLRNERVTGRQAGASVARGAIVGGVSTIAGPLGGTIAKSGGALATGLAAKTASVGISAAGGTLGQASYNVIQEAPISDGLGTAALFAAGGQGLANMIPVKGVDSFAQAKHFAPKSMSSMIATINAQKLTASYFVSASVGMGGTFIDAPDSHPDTARASNAGNRVDVSEHGEFHGGFGHVAK